MKISFNWQDYQSKTDKQKTSQSIENPAYAQTRAAGKGFIHNQTVLDISGKVTDDFTYGDQGRFAEKVMQAAGTEDYVALQRDFMTVMSNSMSAEDFQAMQKDGFDMSNMEPEAVVTILDKIKTVLVQSGTQISGYNDNLSVDKIKEIIGNSGFAQTIAKELQNADAPVTEENVKQIEEAVEQALSVTELGEGNVAYMVSKGMEPILSNLYKAGYSSVNVSRHSSMTGYASNGYSRQGMDIPHTRKTFVSKEDYIQMEDAIKNRIQAEGLEVTQEHLENGKWLLEKGLPVTGENLQLLKEIQDITYPLDPKNIIKQAAIAIGEGRSPFDIHVNTKKESIYKQAVSFYERYQNLSDEAVDYAANQGKSLTLNHMETYVPGMDSGLANIKARKTLEEVRLKMTVEANLKLLQSGFSIDTAPMEELIRSLEQAGKQWEESLFGRTDNQGKGQLYLHTLQETAKLPALPLAVVGKIPYMERSSLEHVIKEGEALQTKLTQAKENYETLMTVPRADMGDDIHKAFRNVDEILRDMNLEVNEANRRAIRIMGYNQITITEDNLNKIKEADSRVRNIMENMKPGLTLELIREGKNPLEMSLEDLETEISNKQNDFIQDTEKYSKFLYKLEQHQEINEAERNAYIGIYRLFRQIEKSDGAVIGRLVAQGAEMNFSNLLSAMRSRKAKATDIRVDDSVGTTSEIKTKGTSISEQIESGLAQVREELLKDTKVAEKEITDLVKEMQEIASDQELEQRFLNDQLREIRTVLKEDLGEVDFLKMYQQPVTVDAMQSSAALRKNRGNAFKEAVALEEELNRTDSKLSAEELSILEEAEQFISHMDQEENRAASYDRIIEQTTTVLEKALEQPAKENGYLDVKEMQMLYKQFKTVSRLAQEENYEIPIQIGEEITSINLKILHQQENKGEVKITMDTEKFGKVEARFTLTPDWLEGSILTDYMDGKEILESKAGALTQALEEALEETKIEVKDLFFGVNEKLDINSVDSYKAESQTADIALLYKVAKKFIVYTKNL